MNDEVKGQPSLSRSNFSPNRSLFLLLSVFFIGLAGASLRVAIALSDHLWLDELHTAWATGAGLDQVATRASEGNQSPLFFWIVWFVREALAGVRVEDGGFALRTVSLLAGCSLSWLAALVVWRWTDSGLAALSGAWLTAVEPVLVFYSTESRPYALMQCLGLIQTICFCNWLNRFRAASETEPKRALFRGADLGLLMSTSAMIAIHVTSLWLPLAEACFLLAIGTSDRIKGKVGVAYTKVWLTGAMIFLLSLILIIPVLLQLNQVLDQRQNWEVISDRKQLVAETQLSLRWGILMPLIGIWVVSLVTGKKGRRNALPADHDAAGRQLGGKLMLVGLWATIPFLGLWLLDFMQIAPAANSRYAQVGTVAFPLFASLAIGGMHQTWARTILMGCVLLSSLILNPWLWPLATSGKTPRLRWEDWGSPIMEINRINLETKRPLLLFSNLIEDRHALTNNRQAFQEYLRFPLFGIPAVELKSHEIMVYPTLQFSGLKSADVRRIHDDLGVWVIIRADEPLVSEILSVIARELNDDAEHPQGDSVVWNIEAAQFDQSPWSDVKLFLVRKPIQQKP